MSNSATTNKLSPNQHKRQIEHYSARWPVYQQFSQLLERILKNACQISLPDAVVQSRAKTVSSFSEKCLRKYPQVQDAVNEFTDLCGVRIIVQTQQQVEAVKQFIEANFLIYEKDDKITRLTEDRFGYRDMHYIIQLLPDRLTALGYDENKFRELGDLMTEIRKNPFQKLHDLKAEIQVRTWLQHGWADTLHDRIYKNPLPPSQETRRTGALLAALMEEGDRSFDRLAVDLDGMMANFTAFAPREQVQDEIEIQALLLDSEPEEKKKPILALKLARLLTSCGDYTRIITVLNPYREIKDANRCELLQELGHAICKVHINQPQSAEYQTGIHLLEESLTLCDCQHRYVVNLRKRENLQARALARLGWALKNIKGQKSKAREYWRRTHECEPDNPYYFAEMLGFEMQFSSLTALTVVMRTTLRKAIKICRTHALDGIELPYAYFTAGRLLLLLDEGYNEIELQKPRESYKALSYYARGIHHILTERHCFPEDVLLHEIDWLESIHEGREDQRPEHMNWAIDLLKLAEQERVRKQATMDSETEIKSIPPLKVLVFSGGAASLRPDMLQKIKPLVESALRPLMTSIEPTFTGKFISGGTISGVPGCVGEVYAELGGKNTRDFELVGYISLHLPADAPWDCRYDRSVKWGESRFTPGLLLKMWHDLFEEKIGPQQVLCFGFGGGPLSMVEYQMALAFGATAAIVATTQGAADEIIADPLWAECSNLFPIPPDTSTIRALVVPPLERFDDQTLEKMAMAFHENYIAGSSSKLPENMKPWEKLAETFKTSNLEQANYSIQILAAHSFGVRESQNPKIFTEFTEEEIEQMAKMEHGRWNIERLRDGWRLGLRDDKQKRHPNLVEWEKVPDGAEGVKNYDRSAIKKLPVILAKAGLEVYRL